ncbi:MAG: iron-binding protein [Planctomycetes bacterium RBG_16_64_10]|nr:MAG: iron-binding protein [Planctomycetes bacterium RBG_16_64_10]
MVTIRVRPNGPLLVEGKFKLVDAQGDAFTVAADKPVTALCRCGHSAKRPFCDGAHQRAGFQAEETARES